jgi:hypothetical protein
MALHEEQPDKDNQNNKPSYSTIIVIKLSL